MVRVYVFHRRLCVKNARTDCERGVRRNHKSGLIEQFGIDEEVSFIRDVYCPVIGKIVFLCLSKCSLFVAFLSLCLPGFVVL